MKRYLLLVLLVLSAVAAHAAAYQGCSLNNNQYDARGVPLACLDLADYGDRVAILLRNQGDETLTLQSVGISRGTDYTYGERGSGTQPAMACALQADKNKDGIPEPLDGTQLAPGASLVVIGPCAGVEGQYSYDTIFVTYTGSNGELHTISGTSYDTSSKKSALSSLSPLVFVPVLVLVVLLIFVLLAAQRSRRKTIVLGGKQ